MIRTDFILMSSLAHAIFLSEGSDMIEIILKILTLLMFALFMILMFFFPRNNYQRMKELQELADINIQEQERCKEKYDMLKDTYKKRLMSLIRWHYEHNDAEFDDVCQTIADELAESGDDNLREYVIGLMGGCNTFVPMDEEIT